MQNTYQLRITFFLQNHTRFAIITVFAFFSFNFGCAKEDFKKAGKDEKAVSSVSAPLPTSDQYKSTPVMISTYRMKVTANTGLELCTGVAHFIISDDFTMKPNGELVCLMLGKVPLNKILGDPEGVQYKKEDMSKLKGAGYVDRKPNPVTLIPGSAEFSPPRPMVLSSLVQNAERFRDYVFTEESSVKGLKDSGEAYQAPGSWYIKVHDINLEFKPEGYTGPLEFKSVIKWEIKGVGFQGAPRASFMAFDSMIYYFNTKPQISIPQIEINTKLSELTAGISGGTGAAGGGILAGLGDALFSGVKIVLTMTDHKPL